MQNNRRGNPRNPNGLHRRNPVRQGNNGIQYGSYGRLDDTFSFNSQYPGTSESGLELNLLHQRTHFSSSQGQLNQTGPFRHVPHQNNNYGGLPPRTRAVSASTDQYQRRPFANPRGTNQRGNGNFRNNNERNELHQNTNPHGTNQRRNSNFRNNNERDGFHQNSGQARRGPRPMGFKALESLLEKDPEQLLLELSNSKKGFGDFLKSNLSEDAIILFIKVLRKVSDSSFVETKYKVLQTYLDEAFVECLTKYIVYLPIQDHEHRRRNRYFWQDSDDFWNNLIRISEDILETTPKFAVEVLPKILKSLHTYIPAFEGAHNRHVSDEIKDNIKRLYEEVQALVKEHEEKAKAQIKEKLSGEHDEEPPDDFRQISVYPSALELIGLRGFVRQNIIKGPYRDVNHYLDVQFRLLREDFVGPLRSGIATFRSESKKRVENVKIYRRVRFLNPETINEHYCIRLRFDFSNKKKSFSYEKSRRFMFGALLCFTADNFKTLIFGKVADRKDLETGELIVGFDHNITVLYNADYLMVECSVFFEPYFHVLTVLKSMTVEGFPMEKYIVQVDPSVQPPEYLTAPTCRYVVQAHEFAPLGTWPNINFYDLNESQLVAFKAALTQEFSIIQGPPGTGKTFLGLKIAKTLLDNKHAWYKKTPMLVICFTNHALDQFLEGLIEHTTRIVRVGRQSKNEKLQGFNLRNRGRFKVSPAILQQRDQVQRILAKIKNITENLKKIDFYDSIRAFDVFADVVANFSNTWFHRAKKNEILDWLLGGRENTVDPPAARADQNLIQMQQQLNDININDGGSESGESDDDEDIAEANEDLEYVDDDIFETDNVMDVQCSFPLITLKSMHDEIFELERTLARLVQIEAPTFEDFAEEEKCQFDLLLLRDNYQYLNMRLLDGKQRQMTEDNPKDVNLVSPDKMKPDDRWRLYFHWLNLYREKLIEKLDRLNKEFRESFKVYEEMRDIENTNSMKEVLVVGMTTTSAARLRSSLQTLKSPVVIVEEAAEVLEAHIITSLTKHCKHLILIGDHQQLKPSTADFHIERHMNLGISLFERMVINQIQCYTLNVQHRMRPEISSLISPTIYQFLEDHPTVNHRPPITGVDHCLFFLDHQHAEANCEGTSKKNYHEVGFLIYLARHLILNGYKPENITILAAYLGQMFELQKERKKHRHILENVRISVLDNYQGEECDIILLSLVRNNEENKIGFLSIENRVCVALSRARNGFYIMGNMTQLCNVSELWRKIRVTFEDHNAIGSELSLRCQVHPDTVTYVKAASDFLAISEGGCNKKCGADLVCGHKCTSLCHVLNRDHVDHKCREKCSRKLCDTNERHLCQKMCYQECGPCIYLVPRALRCGHTVNLECHVDPDAYECVVSVLTKLPCDHETDKPCHCDPATYRCPHPCEAKVEPCGHACTMKCHIRRDPDHLEYKCRKQCARYRKDCTVKTENHLCRKFCFEECDPCLIPVRKRRTICTHVYDVPCSSNVDEIDCEKPCTLLLDCGHKCKSRCNEPCGKCEVKVDKLHPVCGHNIKVKCFEEPNRKLCNKKCPLKLPCGHPCTKKCNEPCTTDCQVMIDCNISSACGHVITRIKCSMLKYNSSIQRDAKLFLKYCNKSCLTKLKCGHSCSGSCGECAQGRIHKRCTEKCGVPLVCDHLCEFPCREACRPCNRGCPYKCVHSSCRKRCGEVCTPCKEKCQRKCEHQKCTMFCGEICNVSPCEEPCRKLLKCRHQCVGFCGDPCPPKCLICDKEELTAIFFGTEDEDARYVLLKDCEHIFESTGLEHWLAQNENEINVKVCPSCKTPIKTTQRYSDYIKRAMTDVAKVKTKSNGTIEENNNKRVQLQQTLRTLKGSSGVLILFCPKLGHVLSALDKRLEISRKGKRQPINKYELNAITSKLQIIEHIINICCKSAVKMDGPQEMYFSQVNFILKILLREEDSVTDQEIDDVNSELNRLSRLVEFSQVKKAPQFDYNLATNLNVRRLVDQIEASNLRKFSQSEEELVKQLLKELAKLVSSGIGISESERRDIVRAMGFAKGHWYKCPNGHPYAIADCGGAMQLSTCNECGAAIGGTNHRLTAGNAVATEMDGARHGAWSQAMNMANYNLRDL